MSERTNIVYIYDGSYDGLMTAVFTAYERHEHPCVIAIEENLQCALNQTAVYITTNSEKSARVQKGIAVKAGDATYQNVWTSFLSHDNDKATKIYQYIRLAMAVGFKINNLITNDTVIAINQICRQISFETQRLAGFVRFSAMDGGIYYAKFTPDNHQIPLLMPHFVDRFGAQPFILHDTSRKLAGVYDLNDWYMVETGDLNLPDLSEDEITYRKMWKRFYDTIAIKERYNPKCRLNHMPKKYWRNMTELSFADNNSIQDATTDTLIHDCGWVHPSLEKSQNSDGFLKG